MGWDSPLLVTRQVHVTLAKVKLLGASGICPQLLLPILSCPDLSSFAVTSVPAERFGWVSVCRCHPKVSVVSPSEVGTLGSC